MVKFNIKNILLILLLIIYIYGIQLTFLPLTAKQIIEVLGIIVYVFSRNKHNGTKEFSKMLPFFVLIQIWGLIVCAFNGTHQYIYLSSFLIGPIAAFFGSFFIYYCSRNIIISSVDLAHFILYAVFFESVLTLLMYFIPSLYDLISNIQVFAVDEDMENNVFIARSRFTGIGNAVYFGVLPSCTIGVMSGVYSLFFAENKKEMYKLLTILFVIISISFLVARYSLIVSAFSLALYAVVIFKNNKKSLIGIIAVALIALFITIQLALTYLPEPILLWAMGAFDSSSEYSSNSIITELFDVDIELKTLILGDGLYTATTGGYYKSFDQGVLRQLFYGGVVGLLLNIGVHYKVLRESYYQIRTPQFKHYINGLMICFLLAMLKGDLVMIDLFILLLVFTSGFNKNVAK